MRVAFSIILNGEHHLEHNYYADFIINNFDLWVIAEGASLSQGSTNWCKKMPGKYHKKGHSIDGTIEYLNELCNYYKKVLISNHFTYNKKYMDEETHFWKSKDDQVNSCINTLIHHCLVNKIDEKKEPIYLWEIDIDEQWNLFSIEKAERELEESSATTGMFLCNYWVGKNLQAKGEWGEGKRLPYRRLWKWNFTKFKQHEPPILIGADKEILLSPRFDHYAYYFDKDVQFKNDWYSGHEEIYKRWKKLQQEAINKPIGWQCPISALLKSNTYWGDSKTIIERVR